MKAKVRTIPGASAATLVGLWAYTHGVQQRSLTSWIAERVLPIRSAHSIFTASNQTQLAKFLHEATIANQRPLHNPAWLVGAHVDELTLRDFVTLSDDVALRDNMAVQNTVPVEDTVTSPAASSVIEQFGSMQIFVWNDHHDPNQHVLLYLHGGGYINQPSVAHFASVARIARLADAKVIFPIYPKLPAHTFQDTYAVLDVLYRALLTQDHGPITIMGDSAGGGLCLGFALYCADHSLPQPSKIIALSPWVDVATDNHEIASVQRYDPMLSAWPTGQVGRLWAGDAQYLTHPYVSPLFASQGQLRALTPIAVFTGTHDILYPDIMKFHDALLRAGVQHRLTVQERMNHVYPLYPIAEAIRAQRDIAQIMLQ